MAQQKAEQQLQDWQFQMENEREKINLRRRTEKFQLQQQEDKKILQVNERELENAKKQRQTKNQDF